MGSKQQCRRGGHAAHRYAAYRRPSNHCKNYKKKPKLYMGCTFLIDLVPNYHQKNAIKISKLSSQVNIGSEGFQKHT